jgi:DNA-binding transcriptional LysR family regulator
MTARGATRRLRIVFDAGMPTARWAPLFHVFRLEHPDLHLEWQPTGFPVRGRSLLEGADAGLFVEPPPEAGCSAFTLDVSPMVVIVAAGDRLAHHTELRVADILDRPFPGGRT